MLMGYTTCKFSWRPICKNVDVIWGYLLVVVRMPLHDSMRRNIYQTVDMTMYYHLKTVLVLLHRNECNLNIVNKEIHSNML